MELVRQAKIKGSHHSCTFKFMEESRYNVITMFNNRYKKYQENNLMHQLMHGTICLHIFVTMIDNVLHVTNGNRCMKVHDFVYKIEKYFIYEPEKHILLYIDSKDENSILKACSSVVESQRAMFVLPDCSIDDLKGCIGILKNPVVHKVKTQSEYDELDLVNNKINVVIQNLPDNGWYMTINMFSLFGTWFCVLVAVVTAYLFWWYSFYFFVFVGSSCLYVYNYVGHDNFQISKKQEQIYPRFNSIFLQNFVD